MILKFYRRVYRNQEFHSQLLNNEIPTIPNLRQVQSLQKFPHEVHFIQTISAKSMRTKDIQKSINKLLYNWYNYLIFIKVPYNLSKI